MPYAFYWLFLLGSIVLEVIGTSILKISQETWPVLGMGLMYCLLGASYFLLAKAVIKVPVGVAYAFWEGIGLVLITLVSVIFLHERLDMTRLLALSMVLTGTLLIHKGTIAETTDTAHPAREKIPGDA